MQSICTLSLRGTELTFIRTGANEARQVDKGCQITAVSTLPIQNRQYLALEAYEHVCRATSWMRGGKLLLWVGRSFG